MTECNNFNTSHASDSRKAALRAAYAQVANAGENAIKQTHSDRGLYFTAFLLNLLHFVSHEGKICAKEVLLAFHVRAIASG